MDRDLRRAASAAEAFVVLRQHVRARLRPLRGEVAELEVTLADKRRRMVELENFQDQLDLLSAEHDSAESAASAVGLQGSFPELDDRAADAVPDVQPLAERDRPGTRCDQIAALMAGAPGRLWRPRDVAAALELGNVNSVRSLMQYMARNGRLFKDADSSYRLPSAQEAPNAADVPPDAEPMNEPMNVCYPDFTSRGDDGVDQRQVAAFLHDNPDRRWRPAEVGQRLGIGDVTALRQVMHALADKGLLVKCGSGRFQHVTGHGGGADGSAGRAV